MSYSERGVMWVMDNQCGRRQAGKKYLVSKPTPPQGNQTALPVHSNIVFKHLQLYRRANWIPGTFGYLRDS